MDKSLLRRLDALRYIADRNRPCQVVVTFTDGSTATTDPAGAIDIFKERDDITAFTPDRPEYDGLFGALSKLCERSED